MEDVFVRSMRSGFTWMDNSAIDDYANIIGGDTLNVYLVYCRRAMNDTQSTKLAQDALAAHLHISQTTVSKAQRELEWVGLIKVKRRHRSVSTVYLLDAKPLTDTVIEQIRERVAAKTKYKKLRKRLLNRLEEFQSLPEHISDHVAEREDEFYPTPPALSTPTPAASNGKQPTGLAADLVSRFKYNTPTLTEKQAAKMIDRYGDEAIIQQLQWLDYRTIQDNPLKTIRAALKGDWGPPHESNGHAYIEAEVEPKPPPAASYPPPQDKDAAWEQVVQKAENQLTRLTFQYLVETKLVEVTPAQWTVACNSEEAIDMLTQRLTVLRRCLPDARLELKFVAKKNRPRARAANSQSSRL